MNFIKKYMLRKKLKKAINYLDERCPYMCTALMIANIKELPGFNYSAFRTFICTFYPNLEYLLWTPSPHIPEHLSGWIEITKETIEARKNFLQMLSNNL